MAERKWSNLIHQLCPKCSKRLRWGRHDFTCPDRKCGFIISGHKMVQIFSDPDHIIHRQMDTSDKELLEDIIETMTNTQ